MPVPSLPAARALALAAALALPGAAGATPPPSFDLPGTLAFDPGSAPVSAAAAGAMVEVPAGEYTLGADDGPASARPAHRVRLGAFAIDRTEVTNAAFAEYLNALPLRIVGEFGAGGASAAALDGPGIGLLAENLPGADVYPIIALDDDEARIGARIGADGGRFVPVPGHADHPVTETTWAGARAYCAWRGARLPTEAEWEAAARGTDGRRYPWGDAAPTPARAFTSGRTGETAPVGSVPEGASPFGALDMSGSLAEWTSSLKRPYPWRADDGREDPALPGERVTRGGDYRFDRRPEVLTAIHRDGFSNAPERGHRHIGFRCARSLGGG